MEMQELTGMLTNTGVTVVIIGYFIFRDFKFMTTLQGTLTSLINTVDTLKEIVKSHYTRIDDGK